MIYYKTFFRQFLRRKRRTKSMNLVTFPVPGKNLLPKYRRITPVRGTPTTTVNKATIPFGHKTLVHPKRMTITKAQTQRGTHKRNPSRFNQFKYRFAA